MCIKMPGCNQNMNQRYYKDSFLNQNKSFNIRYLKILFMNVNA